MNDNHRRVISVTLGQVDEVLCECEQWASGREIRSVLYQETNDLTQDQSAAIKAEATALRRELEEICAHLDLATNEVRVSTAIWSHTSFLWEGLVELEGKYLHAYGEPDPEMVNYLEPRVRHLNEGLTRISHIARRFNHSHDGKPHEPDSESPSRLAPRIQQEERTDS